MEAMKARHVLFLPCLVVSICAFALAQTPATPLEGKVVSITDGDTLVLLVGTTQHKIRLEGIDAPESNQAFGTKAKEALAERVFGKEVKVEWKSRDKYQRILGHIYLGDRWINRELVEEGFAWHFLRYNQDPALAKAEKSARAAKKGLWSDPSPVAPWDFRSGKSRPATMNIIGTTAEVFVTQSGTKYHCDGCRFLVKSKIPILLDDAKKRYQPCGVCKPPR